MAGLQQAGPKSTGGGGGGFTTVTYAQLNVLIVGGTLVQGTTYLISDFRTRQIVPETGGAQIEVGADEPLFVFASSVSTIDKEAVSSIFDTDVLYYDPLDVQFGADRGRLYYREQTETKLIAPHDWRVVNFRRWEDAPASGVFVVATDNGNAFVDRFTFSDSATGGTATNCTLKNFPGSQVNNVIGTGFASAITLGPECNQNTTLDGCTQIEISANGTGNIFLDDCDNIKIGFDSADNTFAEGCTRMTFGDQFTDNVFGTLARSFDFGHQCQSNVFGDNIFNITFGHECSFNSLAFNCADFTFANSCISNVHGEQNTEFTFDEGCSDNTFGDRCKRMALGSDSSINSFGLNCNDITFGSNAFLNTFGEGNKRHTYASECIFNTIGDDCRDWTIGSNAFGNTFGNDNERHIWGNECAFNTIGDNCDSWTIGSNAFGNTFGNDNESHIWGNDCAFNTIGNNCDSITLGSECDDNVFGDQCENIFFGNQVHDRILPLGTVNLEEYLTYGNAGFVYDVSIHGGAIGVHAFGSLPLGAKIMNGYNNNSLAFASAGLAEISFGVAVDDPTFIEAEQDFDDPDYDVNDQGRFGTWSQLSGSNVTTLNNREIIGTVVDADITAGRRVHQFYYIINTT